MGGLLLVVGTTAADSTPSAPSVDTSGWGRYVDGGAGYSLPQPPGWRRLPNFGAPDSVRYFANERVTAPLQMDERGVWLTVQAKSQPQPGCFDRHPPSAQVVDHVELTVGGVATSRYRLSVGNAHFLGATVYARGRCYRFAFVSLTRRARDAAAPTADAMLRGVTFGAR